MSHATATDAEKDTYKIWRESLLRTTVPARFSAGFRGWESRRAEQGTLEASARQWVKNFQPGCTGLLLAGVIGCGKTHLACAILLLLIEQEKASFVKFQNVTDLASEIRGSWDHRDESECAIIESLLETEVLVLDDIGVGMERNQEKGSYMIERYYELFDRITRRGSPVLIVTTNHTLDKLKNLFGPGDGERIVSRLGALTAPLGEFPTCDMRRAQRESEG